MSAYFIVFLFLFGLLVLFYMVRHLGKPIGVLLPNRVKDLSIKGPELALAILAVVGVDGEINGVVSSGKLQQQVKMARLLCSLFVVCFGASFLLRLIL